MGYIHSSQKERNSIRLMSTNHTITSNNQLYIFFFSSSNSFKPFINIQVSSDIADLSWFPLNSKLAHHSGRQHQVTDSKHNIYIPTTHVKTTKFYAFTLFLLVTYANLPVYPQTFTRRHSFENISLMYSWNHLLCQEFHVGITIWIVVDSTRFSFLPWM
jgi:hypothetical protein